jgi:hypothetical protein
VPRNFAAIPLFLVFITACNTDVQNYTEIYTDYVGVANSWSVAFASDGSFEITENGANPNVPDLQLDGIYNRYPTGFDYLMIYDSSSPSGALSPPAPGSTTAAIEIPGQLLIVNPFSGSGAPIPMLLTSSCPSSAFTSNWISTQQSVFCANPTSGPTNCSGLGLLNFVLPGSLSLTSEYNFQGTVVSSQTFDPATCSNGSLETDNGFAFNFSTNGFAMAQSPVNQQIIAVPQFSVDLGAFGTTYSGIFFSNATLTSLPVTLNIPTAGNSATGTSISDVTSNIAGLLNLSLTFSSPNLPMQGFMQATFTSPGAGVMDCAFSQSFIACAGQDPNDNSQAGDLYLVPSH